MEKQTGLITVIRTDSDDSTFLNFVKMLDNELALIYGEKQSFYNQFNKIDKIKYIVIAYINQDPVACSALRGYDKSTTEIKRMFTLNNYRGQGLGKIILSELENWAWELGYNRCILETSIKQKRAINLYLSSGYRKIPNYGQYTNVKNSICYEKLNT